MRVEVHNDHCVMYLNPVFRYNGADVPFEKKDTPEVLRFKTWSVRIVILLLMGLVILAWRRGMKLYGARQSDSKLHV